MVVRAKKCRDGRKPGLKLLRFALCKWTASAACWFDAQLLAPVPSTCHHCASACSLGQMKRVLAATKKLPVEMSIQLDLNARSEPGNNWHAQLLQLQQEHEDSRSLLRAVAKHASAGKGGGNNAHAADRPVLRKLVHAGRLQHT